MLVTILMTSPLVPLLGKEYCTLMVLGSSEEENNNEISSSKHVDGKYFLLKNFLPVDMSLQQEQNLYVSGYIFPELDFTIEILDPPPRKLI